MPCNGEDLLVRRYGQPSNLFLGSVRSSFSNGLAPAQRPGKEDTGRTESAFCIVRPQMPDHASQNLIV